MLALTLIGLLIKYIRLIRQFNKDAVLFKTSFMPSFPHAGSSIFPPGTEEASHRDSNYYLMINRTDSKTHTLSAQTNPLAPNNTMNNMTFRSSMKSWAQTIFSRKGSQFDNHTYLSQNI